MTEQVQSHATLRSLQFLDGSNNVYKFDFEKNVFSHEPVIPAASSSGFYSGGNVAVKQAPLLTHAVAELHEKLRELVGDLRLLSSPCTTLASPPGRKMGECCLSGKITVGGAAAADSGRSGVDSFSVSGDPDEYDLMAWAKEFCEGLVRNAPDACRTEIN